MSGEIDVVEAGAGGTTTQADADAAAKATSGRLLARSSRSRQARLGDVETRQESPTGPRPGTSSRTPRPSPGPLPGGGTGYLELFEMLPPGLEIGVG